MPKRKLHYYKPNFPVNPHNPFTKSNPEKAFGRSEANDMRKKRILEKRFQHQSKNRGERNIEGKVEKKRLVNEKVNGPLLSTPKFLNQNPGKIVMQSYNKL